MLQSYDFTLCASFIFHKRIESIKYDFMLVLACDFTGDIPKNTVRMIHQNNEMQRSLSLDMTCMLAAKIEN